LDSIQANSMEYRPVNSVHELYDAVNYPVECFNSLNPTGFPPHSLTLKFGTLSKKSQPTKTVQLDTSPYNWCSKKSDRSWNYDWIYEYKKGKSVPITRIPLIPSDYLFQFKRIQSPVIVHFPMTINKS
jgi:hypothetical protein